MTGPETSGETTRVLLSPEDLIGFEINGLYRLNGLIGEGGMGVVFRTEQKSIGRQIALKLLKPGGLQGTKRVERFVRETSIIAGLTHPNIVRVFDSGVAEGLGLHFIVMELVQGVSLDTILNTHRMQPEFALEVVYQMCGALSEPHRKGIVHRDIKPENTLVMAMADETIQIKVLDFGIARSHEGDGRITTTGVVMGTPRYMAPETVQGGEIDARTDLYALGIILFEMIVGRTPFAGATPMATMIQHVTEDPPTIADEFVDFKYPELGDLITDLLAKDPEERPESAQAVRKRIDQIRDDYRFRRVRVDPSVSPLDSLAEHLIERGDTGEINRKSLFNTGSWDEAQDYQLTGRLGDELSEGRSADNLLPIPVETARRHLESRGRTLLDLKAPEDFEFDVEAETQEYRSDQHGSIPMSSGSSEVPISTAAPWGAIIGGIAVAAIVAAVAMNWKDTPIVDLNSVPDDIPEVPQVVKELPEEPVVAAIQDLGTDVGDNMSADAGVAEVPSVEPKEQPIPKKRPKTDPKKDPKKDDEYKKGMEWLKPN